MCTPAFHLLSHSSWWKSASVSLFLRFSNLRSTILAPFIDPRTMRCVPLGSISGACSAASDLLASLRLANSSLPSAKAIALMAIRFNPNVNLARDMRGLCL